MALGENPGPVLLFENVLFEVLWFSKIQRCLSKSFQNQLSALFQLWQWSWSTFTDSLLAFGIPLSPRGTLGRSQPRSVDLLGAVSAESHAVFHVHCG